MDWLEVITTTTQDLSDGSADCWNRVRKLADDSYKTWTQATPVEKLSISPPRDEELESGKWSRVNSRGASMVTALHDSVRQEMVQRRSTRSVTALIFRLLTIYQPGGQQEKVTILKNLQHPEQAPDAQGAVKALRSWSRWLRRCKELGVAAPDPSLLTCGLTTITKKVLEKEAEANFRTSLVRSHLMVDTTPSYDTMEKYYHHLLAECETIIASETREDCHYCANHSCADDFPNFKVFFTVNDKVSLLTLVGWFGENRAVSGMRGKEPLCEGQDAVDLKEVLADVGKMLKAMSATSLKTIKVNPGRDEEENDLAMKRVFQEEEKEDGDTGLLDSGASHPMRPAAEAEYACGQNSSGTILVQEEEAKIQPIVPLGAVIETLGYTLHWTPRNLRLTHPSKKTVQVKIRNHCPEALNLIRELEVAQVNELNTRVANLKARLEVIRKEETKDWTELLKDFREQAILTSPITKGLPSDVQSLLLEGFDPHGGEKYLKALPLSRRKRRALMCSRSWVVNCFSGSNEDKQDPFETIPMAGKVVLDIDIAKSRHWDFHGEGGVYQLLLWAAADGRISDVIGSHPHSTWPTFMTPTRGPESYALRTADNIYGIKDLTATQRQRVDNETAFAAKQMVVWLIAQMCGKREECGRISFYMGAFEHKAKRPTTLATTYPSVNQIDKNYDFSDKCVPSSLLSRKEMRKWSRPFKTFVAEAVKDHHTGRFQDEEEMIRAGAKLHKLTKEQREAWHRHLLNDHQPYRADCSVCINAQATGYQHRRRPHPSIYTLGLDLAGHFRQKGRDMDHEDYKYIIVAAYRCPKEYIYMNEKVADFLDKDLSVPDEPEKTG
ncbi:unnamed protein product [Symbiodinium sp. CCMP2456]|nr:unnamed protein product [Symbiodinium sp. CCMP2456]